MTLNERDIPALTVETTEIDDPGSLLGHLDRADPLLWSRRGNGFVGIGTALRLEFAGPGRFADAATAWRRVVQAASVRDPLGTPGTGLVAIGSFAFSDHSGTSSVLIVPAIVIGRRGGIAWVTRIGTRPPASLAPTRETAPEAAATFASTPTPEAFGRECSVAFAPGALTPKAYRATVEQAIARITASNAPAGDGERGRAPDDSAPDDRAPDARAPGDPASARSRTSLSKAVLARDLIGTMQPDADVRHAIEALALGYPDCWTFAIDGFVGSSPETLVSVHRGTVSARVLAGSAARGTDVASDQDASVALATSTKDQDEHEYAVQSVMAALRPHSRGVSASEVPFTLKLPNLWHLASDVEGELDDGSTSLDLIAALHPTAAVAGTPTNSAIELIDELEPFDRGRYAGPVGWVGADGDGEWAIALRCAQVGEGGSVTAWAGAGVVADSVPERELAETSLKFKPIVEAFS